MQTDNRLFDDLARAANGALGALAGLRAEFETHLRGWAESWLKSQNLVAREEFEVVRTTTALQDPHYARPVNGDDLIAFQRLVRRVPVAEAVMRYALSLVRTGRPKSKDAPESVKKYAAFGASVRAAQYLVLGAKARALTSGRYHVTFEDIRSLAHPVLRHRVLTNFRAESEGITSDSIIDDLLSAVATPRSGM